MKKIIEWILYVTSLSPLFLLLILQNYDINFEKLDIEKSIYNNFIKSNTSHKVTLYLLLILILLSIITFLFINNSYKNLNYDNSSSKTTIPELEKYNLDRVDTMSYVGTYIVPMLTINIDNPKTVIVNTLLLAILGKFYVMNEQVFVNPLLNLGGFNIYRSGDNYFLTKIDYRIFIGKISRKESFISSEMVPNVFIIKEKPNE